MRLLPPVGPAPGEGDYYYLKFTMLTKELEARLAFLRRIERLVTRWPMVQLFPRKRAQIASMEIRFFKAIDVDAYAALLAGQGPHSDFSVDSICDWIKAERKVTLEILSRSGTRNPEGLKARL